MNFIIQKLKSKHTFLKKYTNWAKLTQLSLVLREREEKKPKYFTPKKNDLVVKAFGENLTEDVLEKWIKESDISNDGKVNYHDFLRKLSQSKKKQTENLLYAEM